MRVNLEMFPCIWEPKEHSLAHFVAESVRRLRWGSVDSGMPSAEALSRVRPANG